MHQGPTILAIDCSSRHSVVGIVAGTGLLCARLSPSPRAASEGVLPMIDECLRESALSLPHIDAVAVGLGPGSFTGTRIAVATAKGLAQGGSLPVVGVSSLEAAAVDTGHRTGPVAVALDARKSEILLGVYSLRGARRRVGEDSLALVVAEALLAPALVEPGRIAGILSGQDLRGVVRVVGDGTTALAGMLGRSSDSLIVGDPSEPLISNPASLAWLALDRLSRGEFDDPATLEPVYSRPPPVHGSAAITRTDANRPFRRAD